MTTIFYNNPKTQKTMFRISAFKNAEEFKEIFGMETCGNGVVRRKNKILLAFYKSKNVWDWCRTNNDWSLLNIKDMQTLKIKVMRIIEKQSYNKRFSNGWYHCTVLNYLLSSPKYQLDNEGICLDGSSGETGYIRYINRERGCKAYKMSAGKFFNHLLTSTEFGAILPQQVIVWLCEQMCEQWQVYVAEHCPEYELHVSSELCDFERIYSEDECEGYNFGSCMTNNDNYYFYKDAVNCRAAWLENELGYVVARCVIYDNVHDENGKIWRLGERQYSRDCSELLKHQLVNALIKAGEIDAYKQVGAGCGAANAFVDLEGNSLRDKNFWIDCNLEKDDTLSYQDSFKWFDYGKQRAYNYHERGSRCELEETGGYYSGACQYDDYHDDYCYETTTVYYQGAEIQCDTNRMGDFVYYQGDYYHEDEMVSCAECGDDFPDPDVYGEIGSVVYSELTEQCYCCYDCLEEAESQYKEEWWHYSEIDKEYVEDEEDLSTCLIWNEFLGKYQLGHVITANISNHIKNRRLFVHNSILVDDIEAMLKSEEFTNRIADELLRMKNDEVA